MATYATECVTDRWLVGWLMHSPARNGDSNGDGAAIKNGKSGSR